MGLEPTYFVYPTPLGHVTIASDGRAVTGFGFGERVFPGVRRPVAVTNVASTQVQEYLAGRRRAFDVPLAPAGTDFQRLVWDELLRIPYGQTRTYGQVAAAIGRPSAARAVGGANNKNPIPLFIPCHRVVASGGQLGGYAFGVDVKRLLLDLERRGAVGL